MKKQDKKVANTRKAMNLTTTLTLKPHTFRCVVCRIPRGDQYLDVVYFNRTHKKFCTKCTDKFSIPHTPKLVKCEVCPNVYDIHVDGSRFLPGTTKLSCAECMDRYAILMKKQSDKEVPQTWYVVSCEVGKENRVRKSILKTAKKMGLEDKIVRLFSPMHLVDKMVPSYGDPVAMGAGCVNADTAKTESESRRWELERDNPQTAYHDSIWEDEKTGKWNWKVRVDHQELVMKRVSRRKFPGYMIVCLSYDKDMANLFKQVKYCWGLLLADVVTVGLKVKVSWLGSRGAWRWQVKNLKKRVLSQGHVSGKKSGEGRSVAWEHGRTKAESLKADCDMPTGLDSEEAAILVLEHKALKELEKDKERRNAATVPYAVGDIVVVKHGPWTGTVAKVAIIDTEVGNPEASVVVTTRVLEGRLVTIRLKHHQVQKESK